MELVMKATRVITKRGSKGQILAYKWLVNGEEVPENHKYCPKCETIKKKDEFSSAGNACKPCANQRSREWYNTAKNNPEYRKKLTEQGTKRARATKDKIVDYFGNKCHDCGKSYPNCCYDVHHLDPAEKDFNLSAKRGFDEKLKEELDKCILLCSNCHRIRHYKD
jgi:hypothetical protein